MDEMQTLDGRLNLIEESVERVHAALRSSAEQQARILEGMGERARAEVEAVRSYMAMLGGMHVQEAMLMALVATHPDKVKLRIAFEQFWEVYQGGIGSEGPSDAVRHAAQQTLARFGTALGNPAI